MSGDFEQVVVITGAVGNLGTACAHTFHNAGFRLVLVDRSKGRLEQAYPQWRGSANHLFCGGVDLTDPESTATFAQTVIAHWGRIDVLVNTAGAWRGGKAVHETELEDWDFLINTNLRTTLLACRAVIPSMLRQRRGRIINVASRDALTGSAGYAAYSVAKTAVLRLTESLADELKGENINVNCILPSTIDTPQNRLAMPKGDFTKWVEPAALADVILFLASNAARAVTGAAIPVFGKA